MVESRFQTTSPSLTPEEAEVLFIYHLQQAACMFELVRDEFRLPIERFDQYTEAAARAFLENLEAAYSLVDGRKGGDDGC